MSSLGDIITYMDDYIKKSSNSVWMRNKIIYLSNLFVSFLLNEN